MSVPGEPFTFGTLELAQAFGDMASLEQAGRWALHVNLAKPDAHQVGRVFDGLLRSLSAAA